MTAPIATETVLREQLSAWIAGSRRRARTIAFRANPTWTGPAVMQIDGNPVRVVEGVSGLAALDAMRSADASEFVAVLTDLSAAELGSAVMLDVERQRITDLDEWSLVPSYFGVRDMLVPRPVRDLGAWVPRALVALRRDHAYPLAPGGILTAEHVTRSLLVALLRVDRIEALEFSTVLTPLDDEAVRARLAELSPEAREGLLRAVQSHADPHLGLAMRAVSVAGRVSVVAIGLVVAELWEGGAVAPNADVAAARVRMEKYLGPAPSADAAKRFGAAAQLLAKRWLAADDPHVLDIFDQAEAIFVDIAWVEGSKASNLLPVGLHARVERFAKAIEAAIETPDLPSSSAVETALAAIEDHGARSILDRALPTARMATRLVRWLQKAATREAPLDLRSALIEYSTDGAWAERALGDIWDGDTNQGLAAAYGALAHRVQLIRRAEDTAAAAFLTGDLLHDDGVLPVEGVLSQLVVPLSKAHRVMLIVLDGMSVPTAVELAADFGVLGWSEIVRDDSAHRRGVVLAALPTVTEYSRTSLFAGELLAGNQSVEKAKFAAAVNGVVYHKDDLRSEAGHALAPTVRASIADQSKRIVAAVLNTIDDALANTDADALRWTAKSVANLVALLEATREAGRTVILTSDHGHVIERGSELRNISQSSARWRVSDSGPAQLDEREVSGPRVLSPGGTAVLAVSDGLRYASKKAGYHGGASLAELTIPVIVLTPKGAEAPSGWVEAPPQEPTWWNEPSRAEAPVQPTAPGKQAKPKAAAKPASPLEPTLFDPEPEVVTAPTPSLDIATQLTSSQTYLSRRDIAGRHPLDDSVVRSVITALAKGQGRAHRDTLATVAGVPANTFAGLLVALRRVLNVDGYPVVDVDADQVTVVLDVALLREQFEIKGAS